MPENKNTMPALASLTRQAIRTINGGEVREYGEQAAQTFKPGDFLTIDTAGRVAIAATAGNNVVSTGDELVGRALEAATGTTDNKVQVETIKAGTMYVIPDSAATANATIGVECVLTNDTTGGWIATTTTTSNPVLKVIAIAESYDGIEYAVGETRGPIVVKPLNAETLAE